MNVSLIGYRGTGKTTVASVVAEHIGWSWVDADEELQRLAGRSIAEIFADQGELAFRDFETQVLADLSQREHTVLALGGGAILRPENRALIRSAGPAVWLKAEARTLWQRVVADGATAARRPNLTVTGGMDEIIAILSQRTPIYRECADFEVDTEGKTPLEVGGEIITWLTPRLDSTRHP